jgi:hypothetical protein
LSWGGVRAIEDNAVVARSQNMITDAGTLLDADRILQFGRDVFSKLLLTAEGHHLGKVIDMYFNASTGEVVGFQIDGGIIKDSVGNRYFASADEVVRYEEDGVVVSPSSARLLEEQAKSWQRALWDEWQSLMERFESAMDITRKKAADTTDSYAREGEDTDILGERLQDTSTRAQKTISEITDEVRLQLKQLLAEGALSQAKGHMAQHSVLTDDNQFVVIAGQTVSDDELNKARQHHKEILLMESVGVDLDVILNDHALYLQKIAKRYADEWRSDASAVVDSLRKTAIKIANDVKFTQT